MSYQKVTGPLMANSHPGSYCGQDAYSDMFVTEKDNGLRNRKWSAHAVTADALDRRTELHARPTSDYVKWGGVLNLWTL